MKIKHTDYYHICNPLDRNANSGNVCFNINDLTKFDKDFLFDQEVNGVRYTIVLPKEWVRVHMLPMYTTRRTNSFSNKMGNVYVFYILKVEEILKF